VTGGGYVTFDCGSGNVTINVSPVLSVTKTTVIDGGGKITLNGEDRNRILVAQNFTTLSVRNLRFIHGAAARSMDRAIGTGGAVAGLYRSHVEVIGSSFGYNTAGYGGGAVGVGVGVGVGAASTLTIVNSYFTHNSSWEGGASYSLLSPLTIVNSIFLGNTAHNQWGIAMTCGTKGTGAHVMQWGTTSRDTSTPCISGVIAKNARLAAPAANGGPTLTMMPAANSPALNAGRGCEPTDQREKPRNTSVCDLGAVQRTPVAGASGVITASVVPKTSAAVVAAAPAGPAKPGSPAARAPRAVDAAEIGQLPTSQGPTTGTWLVAVTGTGMLVASAALIALLAADRWRARAHRAAD
jgi:hypothetical protein